MMQSWHSFINLCHNHSVYCQCALWFPLLDECFGDLSLEDRTLNNKIQGQRLFFFESRLIPLMLKVMFYRLTYRSDLFGLNRLVLAIWTEPVREPLADFL